VKLNSKLHWKFNQTETIRLLSVFINHKRWKDSIYITVADVQSVLFFFFFFSFYIQVASTDLLKILEERVDANFE
jgi:hypothetical protein